MSFRVVVTRTAAQQLPERLLESAATASSSSCSAHWQTTLTAWAPGCVHRPPASGARRGEYRVRPRSDDASAVVYELDIDHRRDAYAAEPQTLGRPPLGSGPRNRSSRRRPTGRWLVKNDASCTALSFASAYDQCGGQLMPVLQYVKIENFRSIRSVTFDDLADYNPLIGLNSAGKSNILRALNLFFNGLIDEDGASLDFGYDYSTFAPAGKKKRVAVTVGINLNEDFQVPRQRDFEEAHGLTEAIYIRRTWNLAPDNLSTQDFLEFGSTASDLKLVSTDEQSAILAYIRAVRFVYIPNHARPADLIRAELAPLRAALVARLRRTTAYRDASVGNVFEELGRLGERMFGHVSESLQLGLPGTTITPDLPEDFADLIFDVGVNAITSGEARPPEFEGSGAQSFMLLHILDLADRTRRAGGFGWVQASVWAVEEPESFLHAGLRARFSADLFEYAKDERRQIFLTTHQDEFVRVAESAWMTNSGTDGTTVISLPTRDALSESTKRSVTTYRHPLFTYPDVPVVIVEGKWDDIHIRAALTAADRRPRWRLLSPSQALDSDIGGDGVLAYLRYNKNVIASRPDAAPVIVLRDWEDANAVSKYVDVLKVHPASTCLVPPESLTNPRLDQSFVGIERFLGTELIEQCIPKRKLGLEHGGDDARYRVKRDVLEAAKKNLASAVQNGANPGEFMIRLAEWLDDQVTAILTALPATAFQ